MSNNVNAAAASSRSGIAAAVRITPMSEPKRWYAMRDLTRPNATLPAYKQFQAAQIEVFTPMRSCLKIKKGKRIRVQVPFIHDLLFVHETSAVIDSIVDRTPTIQYRYQKGGYRLPITVPDADMDRFIKAVSATDNPKYYLPEELTPAMCNRSIRIVGGELDGYEGKLITVRGSAKKRLLVELPGLFAVGVEVHPDYIRML